MPELTKKDFQTVADYIRAEFERRKERRRNKEKVWKEVDRQLAMDPIKRQTLSGDRQDWFSELELPLQFNALEVIGADARALKFPKDTNWYEVSAFLSGDYEQRWTERREKRNLALIPGALATQIDQETADTIVKVTVDHYHRLYDFRAAINLFDMECIKYGTGVFRVLPVKFSKFSQFRGVTKDTITGPALIPVSIKNTYLDDTAHSVMHEGINISPLVMRNYFQHLKDVQLAAAKGGPERGWIASQVKLLEPKRDQDDKWNHVELVEAEGDVIVPKSKGFLFFPNSLVTIAIGHGNVSVVRFRENPMPFRSYVSHPYIRTDVDDPYGTSPLMKGQPVQEAGTESFNSLMDAGALNVQPPVAYDRFDQGITAAGGLDVHPSAQWPVDDINNVAPQQIGDISALLTAFQVILKLYEDMTGVNDPRRGSGLKSHTTATAADVEQSRGVARTVDFVDDQSMGPLRTELYMEWQIIKSQMNERTPVSVNQGGINGWIELSGADLPDIVDFMVHGASGTVEQRERTRRFNEAVDRVTSLLTLGVQTGQDVPANLLEMAKEVFIRAGVNDAERFIGGVAGLPQGATTGPQVPAGNGGLPANGPQAVPPQGGPG